MRLRFGNAGVLVLLLAHAFLGGCASPAAPARSAAAVAPSSAAPAPLLWHAETDRGGSLFLFGSVHFGTPDLLEFGGGLRHAWEHSDELVVEVDLSRVSPTEVARAMLRYGTLPEGETLESRLSPETWSQLVEQLGAMGIPAQVVSNMKPWLAGISLATLQLQGAGLDPQYGVDQQLMGRAADAKPIVELEGLEFQFATLDSLSPGVQELMLVEAMVRAEDVEGNTTRIIESWRQGDEEALAELFFGEQDSHPEFADLYEKLYFERNESMSERLTQLARDGRTRLVVVGVGHMIGPRGIPALLEERGFSVERVR